ncbi:MAG: insulinase family protein [Planctomycetes bacterium]|nr:insulinase family protein [Planctomycetota bacterium]
MKNGTNTMKTTIATLVLAAVALPLFAADSQKGTGVPKRPEEIKYGPLTFEPPEAAKFRSTLKDGTPVYMAVSKEFPLINLSMTFKGGSYLEPKDMVGLAGMTGRMIREGGTTTMKPAEFDEALDFLATQASANCGDVTSSAGMNCLSKNFDASLKLFMDMLRNPGFDAARLETNRGQALEQMKQRNDDAGSIMGREWSRLMYGSDHFESLDSTEVSLKSITPEKMREFQTRIFNPGNVIIAVSGDFEPQEMLAKLNAAFDGWARGEKMPDPPAPTATIVPGIYHVQKDIPQGKVRVGMRSIKRDDPDYVPYLMLNDILGGGGFTSRIMQQVRSNEGLAYSAGSRLSPKVYYPGVFAAAYESKNPTVALAAKIVLEEMDKVRNQPVTDEELETAKRQFIETFPRTFESKPAMLGVFVNDEMTNRPKDYWKTFREKVMATTPADLQRVAKKYVDPNQMVLLVVGDWSTVGPGDSTGRAKMDDLLGGKVTHLPLRDPMTMQPIVKMDQVAPTPPSTGGEGLAQPR